ncbi:MULTISPECIES: YopX family protein [unclassified Lysinibacillus]|uniref:YopX family protein n=1 Tax=unclassified Lysinibacillus TaxID=2636778 RepID=UPI0020127D6E|nr:MULTISPECIES: YopX family protein [unclassified Lysinibacillus]MCL1696402.1 YopX family protein [Lysinibacillus sp. BPa_S21]MCL1700711.1 YopX family protein [Lysinibacillus sp. Bpr_S20]
MREINFKVFDLYDKEWIKDFVLLPNGEVLGMDKRMNVIFLVSIGADRRYKKCQYTGVKDKNGKKIFGGDIVRTWEEVEHIPNRDSGGGIIDYDQRDGFSQLGVVDFKGAWFTYETKKHLEGRKEEIYAPLDFTNNLEVVGNVYENQELLK